MKISEFNTLLKNSLKEDIGEGDITTNNLIPPIERTKAIIITRQSGVIAGLSVARQVFKLIDKTCRWKAKVKDGQFVKKNKIIAVLEGRARAILSAERVALNFLQHLSGIATLTYRFVKKSRKIKIYDTRKTIPGLRKLQKYAVTCGGGVSHRETLSDMVLIKENHLEICKREKLPLSTLIENLRRKIPKNMKIEIEAKNIIDVKNFLKIDGIDVIMLDNMPYKSMKKAIKLIRKKRKDIEIEVSGNINLKKIDKIRNLEIDRIAIGSLTHSPLALDISLEII